MLRYRFNVTFHFSANDWPMWLVVGAQSAFYIGSLANLPGILGFTITYLLALLGKLASSSVVDAYGWSGRLVQFGWFRGLAFACVLVGSALFSKPEDHPQKGSAAEKKVSGTYLRIIFSSSRPLSKRT